MVANKTIIGEVQSALDTLYIGEWQKLQDSSVTYGHAQMLATNADMSATQAYFYISGLVIDAANKGQNQPRPQVRFYTRELGRKCKDDQQLLLDLKVGDTIISLDPPFKLSFAEDLDGHKRGV